MRRSPFATPTAASSPQAPRDAAEGGCSPAQIAAAIAISVLILYIYSLSSKTIQVSFIDWRYDPATPCTIQELRPPVQAEVIAGVVKKQLKGLSLRNKDVTELVLAAEAEIEKSVAGSKYSLKKEAQTKAAFTRTFIAQRMNWNAQLMELIVLVYKATQGIPQVGLVPAHQVYDKAFKESRSSESAFLQAQELVVSERGELLKAVYEQSSQHVFQQGEHYLTNPTLFGNKVCGAAPSISLFQVSPPSFLSLHRREAAQLMSWNERLWTDLGGELLKLAPHISPDHRVPAAEEMLLAKVKIWTPLEREVRGGNVEGVYAALYRPTLLCSTVTYPGGLALALLQHTLWGMNCDFQLIFVGLDSTDPYNSENAKSLAEAAGFPFEQIVTVKLRASHIDHPEERNVWQRYREVFTYLEEWSNRQSFTHFYFAAEDVYMIPENMYRLLMSDHLWNLHALGTPLLVGNRMIDSQSKKPYVSSGPGFVLNDAAMKLLLAVLPTEDCFSTINGGAEDVLLAMCLAKLDVVPRDTSDEIGEDRFHILSPHWLLLSAVDEGASWWYKGYRPRPLAEMRTNYFKSVSSTSVAWNYVNTPEKALALHHQFWSLN